MGWKFCVTTFGVVWIEIDQEKALEEMMEVTTFGVVWIEIYNFTG